MFYLMTHSTHFYLRLHGVGNMIHDHSEPSCRQFASYDHESTSQSAVDRRLGLGIRTTRLPLSRHNTWTSHAFRLLEWVGRCSPQKRREQFANRSQLSPLDLRTQNVSLPKRQYKRLWREDLRLVNVHFVTFARKVCSLLTPLTFFAMWQMFWKEAQVRRRQIQS